MTTPLPSRFCLLAVLISLAATLPALAATPEQIKKIQLADQLLKAAAVNFRGEKFKESGEQVEQAQKFIGELSEVKEFEKPLELMRDRLQKAHALLELEGIKLSPLEMPKPAAPAGTPGTPAPPAANVPLPTNNLSFVKHIAPIMVSKCGRCHVNDNKGQFSAATFEAFKKGTPEGAVFLPGKGSGSRMIEVIESGDMPRGGVKVSKEELAALIKWIDEGAKFDGSSDKETLAKLVPTAKPAEPPRLSVAAATGKESVSYSKDIAPVLAASCLGCHSDRDAKADLRMDSFASLLRGGESGVPWTPGNAKESLLFKKISGTTAGARMPFKKPALPTDVIAKFEKWINEGAKFDGPDPQQTTEILAATVKARAANHSELMQQRAESAQKKFRLANPSGTPVVRETKNFYIIGNAFDGVMDDVEKAAEEQAAAVAKLFKTSADAPLVKGRITLFVFKARYDYSEYGQMVEQRPLPPQSRGHWKFDVIDAYGAIVAPSNPGDYTAAGIVGQQVAAIYAASLNEKIPNWFAEGVGRTFASRVDAKAPRTLQWDERLSTLLGEGKVEGFLNRSLSGDDNDVAAYGFVRGLMGNNTKFPALVLALRGGEDFDRAFTRTFGDPKAIVAGWIGSAKSTGVKRPK